MVGGADPKYCPLKASSGRQCPQECDVTDWSDLAAKLVKLIMHRHKFAHDSSSTTPP